jgi:hypothetical protein
MNTSMRTRSLVATLAIAAVAPVAPAAAGVYAPITEPQLAQEQLAADRGSDYQSVNAIAHTVDEPSSQSGPSSSLNAIVHPVDEPNSQKATESLAAGRGYASATSITGPSTDVPATVASSTGSSNDGFDWGAAALGAGAVAALLALGGAGFFANRRRTGMAPSASTT